MRRILVCGVFLLALAMLAMPTPSSAQISVGVAVHIGPPALPVYEQPICPAPGYLWTPGYWAYGPDGYFWVPGTWVEPPAVGLLWTPGYWGWRDGGYYWHGGYWGPHIGFYGGINYGFGYFGTGFVGGRWNHGVFAYNTAVMRVNTVEIHNTYIDRTVVRNVTVNRVSFNGGRGGVMARPSRGEMEAEHEHHFERTAAQENHRREASTNRAFLASVNHGRPAVAATARPGEFSGRGAVGARGNENRPSNAMNEHRNADTRGQRNDRPPQTAIERRNGSYQGNAGQGNAGNRPAPHAMNNEARPNRPNEGARGATPRNQPRAENRPPKANRPNQEAKPHQESKPHNEERPHRG
ncbi:MAG TPA: hypothetical protein VJN93_17810 [Candidatus Acidoferrum sp.]|nr:hypothetical protein [Candidatus Acidoferrum sp.]